MDCEKRAVAGILTRERKILSDCMYVIQIELALGIVDVQPAGSLSIIKRKVGGY